MSKRIAAMVTIFAFTTVAWLILGTTTAMRSNSQDLKLRSSVGQLWGTAQSQAAPRLFTERSVTRIIQGENQYAPDIAKDETVRDYHPLDSSTINVKLDLEHRKKGLLWYPTYRVAFDGDYLVSNHTSEAQDFVLEYEFPVKDGMFDNFYLRVNGDSVDDLNPRAGKVRYALSLEPGEERRLEIAYNSQGMSEWWYNFGKDVSQVKDLTLSLNTNFDQINFPEDGISPTEMKKTSEGWNLTWSYGNLISGLQIGMEMPRQLNPGPFVSRVTFFAPVSLFFFFFVFFMIVTLKKIEIHPMNYFFIAAAFFAFHLLLAYLADHIDIHLAMAISSSVSIFLVVSYMRLVIGLKFALVETGITQFVFLVGFSYAFLLEGFTGLAITICAILTLFITMQYTARFDWKTASLSAGNLPQTSG